MDPETMKHLFQPFFTTKDVGKGSGLGLAMVYGIVKQSGGYIWAYSEPGMGTTLKLYFPSVAEDSSQTAPGMVQEPSGGGGGRILVVEDDPLVREMTRRALVDAGFEVLSAGNGREALAMADDNHIDAVLTDLAMPEIGGRELAARLRESRPDLPVVFISGYTDEIVTRRGLLDSGMSFLEKPVAPEVLTRKLREVLDGRAL
jgi:CheY-like chemotaxis protein